MKTYHIILADDDPSVQAVLLHVLQRLYEPVTISSVANGLDALTIFQQQGADLVLTDYQMPQLNGIDLVKILRSSHHTLPILLLSSDASIRASALASGASRFLAKPMQLTQLLQTLQELLPPNRP